MKEFACTLPWPPSVNTYYTVWKGRKILSKKGKQFKKDCAEHIRPQSEPMTGNLWVGVVVSFPDNRKRDLDNLLKPILDVLDDYNVYVDDSQIWDLRIKRINAGKGEVIVTVKEIQT